MTARKKIYRHTPTQKHNKIGKHVITALNYTLLEKKK